MTEPTFQQRYNGPLHGLMQWRHWDELRPRLAEGAWYVYAIGQGAPDTPSIGPALIAQLDGIDALLRREHQEDYLGIVYVDDQTQPSLVKIYDPNHLGTACSKGGSAIPPGWVISRQAPEPIASDIPLPAARVRWWSSLLGRVLQSPATPAQDASHGSRTAR